MGTNLLRRIRWKKAQTRTGQDNWRVKSRIEVPRAGQYNRLEHSVMAHTPLAKLLCHAASTAARSSKPDVITDNSAISRRQFVRTISAATAGLALPSSLFAARRVATSARVAVIGAGLAGLTCAYRLKQNGIVATLYEANTRLGGRCWTRHDDFANGQVA